MRQVLIGRRQGRRQVEKEVKAIEDEAGKDRKGQEHLRYK
jgi:hypothetical protein